jgi:light-independent protochlorophyllide reductase subunit B
MEAHLLEICWGHDTKEVITKGIYTNSDLNGNQEAQVEVELNKIPSFVRVHQCYSKTDSNLVRQVFI